MNHSARSTPLSLSFFKKKKKRHSTVCNTDDNGSTRACSVHLDLRDVDFPALDSIANALADGLFNVQARSLRGAHSSSVDTTPGASRDGGASAADPPSAVESGQKLPPAKRPRAETSAAESADVLSPPPKTSVAEVTAPKTPAGDMPPVAKPTPDLPSIAMAAEAEPEGPPAAMKREGSPSGKDQRGVEPSSTHQSPDDVAPAGLDMKPTPETPRPRTKHRRKPEGEPSSPMVSSLS
jgi:hypothetical protein